MRTYICSGNWCTSQTSSSSTPLMASSSGATGNLQRKAQTVAKTKEKDETELLQESGLPSTSSGEIATVSKEDMAEAAQFAGATKDRNEQAMQTFITWLTERADTTDEDQYAVMASILAEMMDAASPEEVMRERTTMRATEAVGIPLILHGFEIRAGEYEDSLLGFYAAMTVSRPGMDTTRILTCGATKVLMKLYALDTFNEWPQAFCFSAKQGKKGTILDIVRP